jgi:hypothetical protein
LIFDFGFPNQMQSVWTHRKVNCCLHSALHANGVSAGMLGSGH